MRSVEWDGGGGTLLTAGGEMFVQRFNGGIWVMFRSGIHVVKTSDRQNIFIFVVIYGGSSSEFRGIFYRFARSDISNKEK